MHSFITFDRSGANKYFDNFNVRTGISSWPHDFLESNPLISQIFLLTYITTFEPETPAGHPKSQKTRIVA